MNEFSEGTDYYFNEEGMMVFTEQFLLRRGFCCTSGCLHCPYNKNQEPGSVPGVQQDVNRGNASEPGTFDPSGDQ